MHKHPCADGGVYPGYTFWRRPRVLSVVLCLCSGDLLLGQGDLAGAGVSHDTQNGENELAGKNTSQK